MIQYVYTPLNFFTLLRKCFAAYLPIAKQTWALILLSSFLSVIPAVVAKFDVYVSMAISVLIFLALVFIYSVLLHMSHITLTGKPPVLKESLANAKKRYLPLLGGYIVFILIGLIFYVVGRAIFTFGTLVNFDSLALILVFLLVVAAIFLLFSVYFALPLIILEHHPVIDSFTKSIRLVWRHFWFTFAILLVVHLVVLLIANIGFVFITSRDVLVLGIWNFIYMLLVYPLLIATTLMVLNDLRLRSKQQTV